MVWRVGSYAAKAREPRQDRKVATVNGPFWVTWECLA
jgi:hypothetical protein